MKKTAPQAITTLILNALTALTCVSVLTPALANWTVEQRQYQLMQDINAGQKGKQLTAKEADKLRKRLAHVARKKAKMKEKGDGKLTENDKRELESDLNDVSVAITKLKLEKRAEEPENKIKK